MANTYTQIHIQTVFAVRNRECVIGKAWKEELHKYITGIIQNQGHKLLAIHAMPDHVHILFGMRPSQSLSGLLQDIKADSSQWINNQKFAGEKFSWQEGYGAFSYGKLDVSRVIRYIENQEEHHRKKTFSEEYREFLDEFDIVYDERYVFKPIEY